eukprot:GHVU01016960.1.p1 GENE.GHVU01016960.1~~GHVU01016960.1.p1  ORF type:complete len:140 (-),score=22.57 GHVU01016960.1:139-558(-)
MPTRRVAANTAKECQVEDESEEGGEEDDEGEEGEDSNDDSDDHGATEPKHDEMWNDEYEVELGLDPRRIRDVVVSARCKFCSRFGRKRAGAPRQRNAIKKAKQYHLFRKDNIKRHHKTQHGSHWANYCHWANQRRSAGR